MPSGLFFIDHGVVQRQRPTKKVQEAWDRAKMICEGCPVMRECARDSLGEVEGVWGGLDPAQRLRLRELHGHRVRNLTGPVKDEYVALVGKLRQQRDMPWFDVARTVGMGVRAVQHLYDLYEESRPQPVETPAPVLEIVRTQRPFPDRPPTEGDGWVRHDGRVLRAYYLGETESGEWLFIKAPLDKEYTHAWFKAEDVKLTREMPRVLRERAEKRSRIYATRVSHGGGRQAG